VHHMKIIDWRSPHWRKRFWTLLTVVTVVMFASHPELRLLVPVLDAIGLDVFLALLGLHLTTLLSATLQPLFLAAWHRLVPVLRAADRISMSFAPLRFVRDVARYALFNWVGGPRAWLRVHKLFRLARLGPAASFRRSSGQAARA
jgi:hypothetical protein